MARVANFLVFFVFSIIHMFCIVEKKRGRRKEDDRWGKEKERKRGRGEEGKRRRGGVRTSKRRREKKEREKIRKERKSRWLDGALSPAGP